MPDQYSDIIINSGNVLLSSDQTIGSLSVNTAATVTVGAGWHLTVVR